MNVAVSQKRPRGLARVKFFLALSRTPHGLLDMATPGLAVLLWLGVFPSAWTIALGLITAFAGYTSVYALNDVVDYKTDTKRLQMTGFRDCANYLDATILRHPIAQGCLTLKEGLIWLLAWGLVALLGAFLLNPVCVLIFLGGFAFEIIYCLMWKISPFRSLVSGAVKSCGPLAAVLAVDPEPSPFFLLFLFLWFFFWEIGGQNIPNDWAEIEEDRQLHARTILVQYGVEKAGRIIIVSLAFALGLSLIVPGMTERPFPIPYMLGFMLIGFGLLILPAYRLYKTRERGDALTLFGKASYYPLACLILVTVRIVIAK